MVGAQGFEPRMPEATDLQSAEVTNASRHPTSHPSICSTDSVDGQVWFLDLPNTCIRYRGG